VARFRTWWQKNKWRVLSGIAIIVVLIALIIKGYSLDWTGFNGHNKSGKSLWDWMQLLFIPVVLAVAGFWFNHRERKAAELRAENERKAEELRAKAEQKIALDNQREAALQAYLDRMAELLLEKNLRKSEMSDEVRSVGRARTLSVLPQLNGLRKRILIQFLHEADLLSIISLRNADLSNAILSFGDLKGTDLFNVNLTGADLKRARLSGIDLQNSYLNKAKLCEADLSGSNLSHAELIKANLSGANLRGTNLSGANLKRAVLRGVDLSETYLYEVDLRGADVTDEQLEKAKSLKDAIMPDGSKHP